MYHQELNNQRVQTVVFLHGANTGGWMWERVIEHLHDFHCVTVDFPGHNNNRKERWVSIRDTAACVAECIRRHGHDSKAHVVGLSLGGYVALHLLADQPEFVRNVVVSGVPSSLIPYRLAIRAMGTFMAPFIHTDRFLRMGARSLNIPDEDQSKFIELSKRNTKQAFRSVNRDALGFIPPEAALSTPNRKLFIAGSREHPLIKESLLTFARSTNAVSAEVQNLGHGWSAESPELFAQVTRAWIEGHVLPSGVEVVT